MRKLIVMTALLLVGTSSHAALVLLDADDFSVGADVSHALDGALMRVIRNEFIDGNMVTSVSPLTVMSCVDGADWCGSREGLRQFDSGLGERGGFYESNSGEACMRNPGSSGCYQTFSFLEITFARSTDFIGFDANWFSDMPGFYAFDALGNSLGICYQAAAVAGCSYETEHAAGRGFTLLSMQRDQADIARVVFGGINGNVRLGAVTANVPEPHTAALFALGLLLVLAARRPLLSTS